ncbi:MAG: CNNM domain-containing protein [Planctomycetota bacterium]
MTGVELAIIGTLVILLLCSGLASGSETALFGASRSELGELRARNARLADIVERLRAHPRRLLIAVLVVNMVVNTLYFVGVSTLARGVDSATWSGLVGAAGVLGIVVVGEVLAKLLASARRALFLAVVAPGAALGLRVFGLIVALIDKGVLSPLTRLVVPGAASELRVTPGELVGVVDRAERAGDIHEGEEALLKSVVQLGDVKLRELMTPRTRLEVIDNSLHDAKTLIRDQIASSGRHRVLVGDGGIEGGRLAIHDARIADSVPVMLPVLPDVIPAARALDSLVNAPAVVCVDEHGGVTGLVDRGALIDWLLRAEDRGSQAAPRLVGVGEWLVPGSFRARDWAEAVGIDPTQLPAGPATVAGVLAAIVGRTPEAGESGEVAGMRFVAEEVEGQVVTVVRVILVAGGSEA